VNATIVIPCYNEAARFPVDYFTGFADHHPGLRFLLVNDGSRDGTLAMLHQASAGRENRVAVLDLPVNGGKGEAVRQGLLRAIDEGAAVVGFWDADFATPLDAIPEFLEVLRDRPALDMVFGARVKLLGRQIDRRPVRHYLGRIFATAVSNLLRLPIYDTQCGAKIFRVTGPATRALFIDPFLSRWVFDVEIIARYIRARGFDRSRVENAIYEFALRQWRDVAGSKVKPRDFLRALLDVWRIQQAYRLK
jgi:glycosyltransferase involved in cell wall biosynthesis